MRSHERPLHVISSLVAAAALVVFAAPATAATVTLRPVADTYTSSQSPNSTYGSLDSMKAESSPVRKSYLRFDVQGLTAPITKATLKVYATSSGAASGVSARAVADTTWGEYATTYDNAPPVGAELSHVGAYRSGTWVSFEVTPQVTGNGLVSVALTTTSAAKRTFATRESSNTPQLVLETGDSTSASPTPAPSPTPSPTPSPAGLFSPTSYLNAPLASDAPLDSSSASIVNSLVSMTTRYATGINSSSWTTRVYEVPSTQPTMRVVLDQSNADLQAAFDQVPLPPDALPDTQSDHHLTVWQKSSDTLWEFWGFYWSGTTPHAKYGGRMQHVSTNPGHFVDDGTSQHRDWGATATSIPLLAGLIRYSEAQALNIPHGIALSVPEQNCQWRNPAQRTDGGCTPVGNVPAGARFRLPASLDVDALSCSPLCKAIARAAQSYGLVVRDHAGAVAMYGENVGASWSSTIPGGTSLAGFPWSSLQVLPPTTD